MAIKYEEDTKPETRGRGRPSLDRVQISIRLDQDIVEKLKEDGPGWQARMNTVLRGALRLPKEKAAQKSVRKTPERK